MVYLHILFALSLSLASALRARTCEPWMLSDLVSQGRAVVDGRDDASDGMRKSYAGGLRSVGPMIRLSEALRDPKTGSAFAHVGPFDSLIDEHIALVESGLRLQDDNSERLAMLEGFKSEALGRRRSGRVDYRWWTPFNYRLAILATPEPRREMFFNSVGKALSRYFDLFPHTVLVPTIEELGIVPFRKLFMTGVHPLGLVGRRILADGEHMPPDRFVRHDLFHAGAIIDRAEVPSDNEADVGRWREAREGLLRFHNAFDTALGRLSGAEREMAELVYFLVIRERPERMYAMPAATKSPLEATDLFGENISRMVYEFRDPRSALLLPEGMNYRSEAEVHRFLSESIDVFNRIASEIGAQSDAFP